MSDEPDVTTVCPKCMSVNVQRLGLQSLGQPEISAPISGRCLDCGHVYETANGKEVLKPNTFHIENEDGQEVEVSKEEFDEHIARAEDEDEDGPAFVRNEIEELTCADCASEKFAIQIRGNEFRAICCGCNQVVLEVTMPAATAG